MSKMRLLLIIGFSLALCTVLGMSYIYYRIHKYDDRILDPQQLNTAGWTEPRIAIVFGASVRQDELSTMLEDRVQTAINLYKAGKVDRILVSGDNRRPEYNEPKAMADYLLSHAVDPKHIVVDYAGRSTYETCMRAYTIFGVRQAVLISQHTHLPRALYLANELGINGIGIIADIHNYGNATSYQKFREIGASLKAFYNIQFSPPSVILGEKIPIK